MPCTAQLSLSPVQLKIGWNGKHSETPILFKHLQVLRSIPNREGGGLAICLRCSEESEDASENTLEQSKVSLDVLMYI